MNICNIDSKTIKCSRCKNTAKIMIKFNSGIIEYRCLKCKK